LPGHPSERSTGHGARASRVISSVAVFQDQRATPAASVAMRGRRVSQVCSTVVSAIIIDWHTVIVANRLARRVPPVVEECPRSHFRD
jgi:hypothetical protein